MMIKINYFIETHPEGRHDSVTMKDMNTQNYSGVGNSPQTHSPTTSPPRSRIFTIGAEGNPDIVRKRLFPKPSTMQKGK